jgi:hypothetical protein
LARSRKGHGTDHSNHIDPEGHQFRREAGQAIKLPGSEASFHREGLALNLTDVPHTLLECGKAWIGPVSGEENADPRGS